MKPGWKTSEFWVTATTIFGAFCSAAAGRLDGKWAALVAGIGAASYAYSRGHAKSGGGVSAAAIVEKGASDAAE